MTSIPGMSFLQNIQDGNYAAVQTVVQNRTVNLDERDEVGSQSSAFVHSLCFVHIKYINFSWWLNCSSLILASNAQLNYSLRMASYWSCFNLVTGVSGLLFT